MSDALVIGVAGALYGMVILELVQPGEALSWIRRVLPGDLEDPNPVYDMLHRAVYGCAKCAAGQFALWVTLIHWLCGGYTTLAALPTACAIAVGMAHYYTERQS